MYDLGQQYGESTEHCNINGEDIPNRYLRLVAGGHRAGLACESVRGQLEIH